MAKPESIIEGVAAYFLACPHLADGAFRVDALGDEPMEYVIGVGAFDPVIETYVDGSSDRRYRVTFGSREKYGLDRIQNMDNSAFYERLSGWIEARNKAGELPELPDGCTAETIYPVTSGFLIDDNDQTARYQIEIELTYHKSA